MSLLNLPADILRRVIKPYRYWQCLRLTCTYIHSVLGDYDTYYGGYYSVNYVNMNRQSYMSRLLEYYTNKSRSHCTIHIYHSDMAHLYTCVNLCTKSDTNPGITIFNGVEERYKLYWASKRCTNIVIGCKKLFMGSSDDIAEFIYFIFEHCPEIYPHIIIA